MSLVYGKNPSRKIPIVSRFSRYCRKSYRKGSLFCSTFPVNIFRTNNFLSTFTQTFLQNESTFYPANIHTCLAFFAFVSSSSSSSASYLYRFSFLRFRFIFILVIRIDWSEDRFGLSCSVSW